MAIKPRLLAALLVSHILVGLAVFYAAPRREAEHPKFVPPIRIGTVLDGDTVVVDGTAIHIRGIDAPELGPWAHCWAEAELAGFSRQALESELVGPKWKLVDRMTDKAGTVSARFVDAKGFDLTDNLRVEGYAALTDQRWDWCGTHANLHDPQIGEQAPEGPQLWWPSGNMYDARAND